MAKAKTAPSVKAERDIIELKRMFLLIIFFYYTLLLTRRTRFFCIKKSRSHMGTARKTYPNSYLFRR